MPVRVSNGRGRGGRRAVSTAPLIPFIKQRAEELRRFNDNDMGYKTLATQVAQTTGVSFRAIDRQLIRIVNGEQKLLKDKTADRWAIALGMMPGEIWGDEWTQWWS